ncbi:hypothetical protein Sme01_56690 [Sphaerisporangium melleum]|uniref:Uncharacterized protein n=1 Tax=Sphaerisporangium melleum TaxID=321316 RepID=A0A917RFI3_9ACTN|nr:hypothetical protein GCM10007964_54740 [Sphaerisporangium melleum]GII73193.1 hypothetical protein Sme01_56690 [Sphaerisporangium melleum]
MEKASVNTHINRTIFCSGGLRVGAAARRPITGSRPPGDGGVPHAACQGRVRPWRRGGNSAIKGAEWHTPKMARPAARAFQGSSG